MPTQPLLIDGHSLTLDHLVDVARRGAAVGLDPTARQRVSDSAQLVERLVDHREPVYGVNTGFGVFADRRIDRADLADLSSNLLLSHAVGFGDPFPREVVRAAMLIRANTFAIGVSGVRPTVVETLLQMLEKGVTPFIPSQGSLGSSGDLAPLAHLGLVMTSASDEPRSGRAWFGDSLLSGAEAMRRAGVPRIRLGPKEGLALTNGATFATALLALGCIDGEACLEAAEAAAAITMEALLARSAALSEQLHASRPHPGQARVAARLRALLNGSQLIDSGGQVQDAYSLRCSPQVIGPVWEILGYCREVATREINSATDNPLLFEGTAVSGGNFHGEPVGLAADYLKIALSEVAALSERRVFRTLSAHLNAGLPGMLVARPEAAGLQSGFMMLQYTAASLVLENQSLGMPASMLSLPTSADQEDHNANATTAARHLAQVIANLRRVIAIEFLVGCQALELRMRSAPGGKPGAGSSAIHAAVREVAPFADRDDISAPSLEAIEALIAAREFAHIGRGLDE
ncbi:MAG TPA: histidine ammonia-lyase [Anaerolineales bacterium]|nr:histidine ammonia-lyase [Anaerolineales bacterium]